jgi:hypothetical protein
MTLSLCGTARITDERQRLDPALAKVVEQEQPE